VRTIAGIFYDPGLTAGALDKIMSTILVVYYQVTRSMMRRIAGNQLQSRKRRGASSGRRSCPVTPGTGRCCPCIMCRPSPTCAWSTTV